jgi:hypothetical protein
VIMSTSPKICSRRTIQLPGVGISRAVFGNAAAIMKGEAMPRPMDRNTTATTRGGWNRDQARTPPRKGPLQGVARRVARRPVRYPSMEMERERTGPFMPTLTWGSL